MQKVRRTAKRGMLSIVVPPLNSVHVFIKCSFQCLPGGCHLLVEFRNQQVAEFHRALLFHSLRVLSSLYCLMLIISNEDIESVLTLDVAFKALERAYLDQASGRAVNRPRSDLYLPAGPDVRTHAFTSVEAGLLDT